MIKKYLIPLWYFHHTRLSSVFQKISWIGVYWVPTLLIPFFIFKQNLISVLIIILGINYVYENGYIQNDIYTVTSDNNPTERILAKERNWFKSNIYIIAGARVAIFMLLLVVLYIATLDMKLIVAYVAMLTFLQACFNVYNLVKNSRLKHVLIIPLSYIRFHGSLLTLYFSKNQESQSFMVLLFLGLILYPVEKWLEFGKKHGAFWGKHIGDIDKFRIYYYMISTIALFALTFILDNKGIKIFAAFSLYYTFLRVLTNFLGKRFVKKLNRQSWVDSVDTASVPK